MATLPSVDTLARPTAQPQTGVVSYRTGLEQGELQGRALAQAGQNMVQTSLQLVTAFEQERERQETSRAEELSTKYKNAALDLRESDNGYERVKSGDAVNGNLVQDYSKRLAEARKGLSEGIESPTLRQKFSQRADITDLQFRDNLLTHFNKQRAVYNDEVLDGKVKLILRSADMDPGNQEQYETDKTILRNLIVENGKLKGLSPSRPDDNAALNDAYEKAVSAIAVTRVNSLLYRHNDPLNAEKILSIVKDDIKDPHALGNLENRVTNASINLHAKNEADRLVTQEVKAWQAQPKAPRTVPSSLDQTMSGVPTSNDVRAMLPAILDKAKSLADERYGTNVNNPLRQAFEDRLINEANAKIALEAKRLDVMQHQTQSKLINFISGFDGNRPVTAASQLTANPEMMQLWDASPPESKRALDGMIHQNLVRERGETRQGNEDLMYALSKRINSPSGAPGKINYAQELYQHFRPGGLSTGQLHELLRQVNAPDSPSGRSLEQSKNEAYKTAREFFHADLTMQAMGTDALAARRWFDDFKAELDRRAGKNEPWESMVQQTIGGKPNPESWLSAEVLNRYKSGSRADATAALAAKATGDRIALPANLKTDAEISAWVQQLPANILVVDTPSGPKRIPGRGVKPEEPKKMNPSRFGMPSQNLGQ